MLKTPLKSIPEERADCIAAFEAHPDARHVWNCHHEVICEPLGLEAETRFLSFMDRINYIAARKPEKEQALRFRNFRPVLKEEEKFQALFAAYTKVVEEISRRWNATIKPAYATLEAAILPLNAKFIHAEAAAEIAYNEATKEANTVYKAALLDGASEEAALTAFNIATKLARVTRTKASEKAYAEYYSARAAHDAANSKVCREATATRNAAKRAAGVALCELHDEQYPDNSWNGTSIFQTTDTVS